MISTLVSEFKKKWLINILGLIFFIIGFGILNANERRAFHHRASLNDAFSEVISVNQDYSEHRDKSRDYEGKIIHLIGKLKVQEPLGDSTYNILVQSVKLKKIVEIYQWHEDFTENKFMSPDDGDTRSYYYYKDWSEQLIDSRSFHSLSHQNPRKKPMESKVMIADKVYISFDNFYVEISDEAKEKFNIWIDITSDTRPDDFFIKMHAGAYYHTENDIFSPEVGDMRVKFQLAGLEGDFYTICGKFHKGRIVPYQTSKHKKKILLLSKGEHNIGEIFHQEHSSLLKETWFARLFGFIIYLFFVMTNESLLRILLLNSKLSFLAPNPRSQIRSNAKLAFCLTLATCVFRQSLHYLGIFK